MPLTPLIEVETLRSDPDRETFVILDCRFDLAAPQAGRAAYLAGHIPGAQYADLNRDLSSAATATSGRHPLPDAHSFARLAANWGIGNETTTIVYDESNGSFAARAWWLLRWIGATRVAVLNGGLAAWRDSGAALEAGEGRTREPQPFAARVQSNFFLTTNEVIDALADPSTVLVDARAPARFAGETEPIDPVAGHVPGAENFPFTQNLGADGRFLTAEELRKRWSALLRGRKACQLISMCGSGITACHNLLALEIAGFSGAQLYAGSWSEWIRDPARPVAANPDRAK
jgi:thiosulfate/3-mercaptopyruvate sulfurtransferase